MKILVIAFCLLLASFTFNMTKQLQDEGRLLEFCIHNTTIKIADLDKFCGLRYGGLNSSYGESVN